MMLKALKIFGLSITFAFMMSVGMVAVFIPASHLFVIFFEAFAPPLPVSVWIKIGISVFLPINFILNMFVYTQRRLKAYIDSL